MELHYIDRPFELKAVDEKGLFTGYGSVFGNVDVYDEVVAPGAFADSLAAWKTAGRLPPVLWQHRSGEPVGPHLEMAEDSHGLFVKGQLLIDDVARAKEARALMQAKAINGLSIGFVTREDSYDRVTGIRTLKKVDLWEVSIVTFPANPQAQIANVKSAYGALETLADVERHLRDAHGISKTESVALVSRIKSLAGRSDSDAADDLIPGLLALQKSLQGRSDSDPLGDLSQGLAALHAILID
jgi:HK97 family phage prohead protease